MQACKLIMFYYACTHVRSRVWSGSAAKGVLRKRAQIGAPVRKGTHILARTLPDFASVSFEDLWLRLKPWMKKKGYLVDLRGKRGSYRAKVQETPHRSLFGGSSAFLP